MKYKAVIFDMDGVIFDSERLSLACWEETAKKFGLTGIERYCDLSRGVNEAGSAKIFYSLYGEKRDRVVLVRQYRYAIGGYIYEFPAGLVEPNEEFHEGAVREMYEETGLKFTPLKVDPAFEKPYFTTVGMTDESCATVYGYAEGEISKDAQEDTEEIEVVLADREEVKRILREENVAIMCAYQLMHFLQDEEPFAFLREEL